VLADPALGGARSTRAVRNTPATCPRITTAREKRRGRKIGRLGSRSAPPVRRTATEGKMGGRKMEDGDWNLPYSARRLDHTRLHSCSVAELFRPQLQLDGTSNSPHRPPQRISAAQQVW
jgi:hypothetical protein